MADIREAHEIIYIHGGNIGRMLTAQHALLGVKVINDEKAKLMLDKLKHDQSKLQEYLFSDEYWEREYREK